MSAAAQLRAMIVDDEAPAREGLLLRLRRERDVVVIGTFGGAQTALNAIASDPPDLLFLDIQMRGMDGFGLCERAVGFGVRHVVFVTAFDEHAVRAFELRALDYLLKPVQQERLHDAVERARALLDQKRSGEFAARLRQLVADFDLCGVPAVTRGERGAKSAQRIPVRNDGTIRFVHVNDVDYVDAAGDAVRLHVGRTTHEVRRSMSEMLAVLPANQFVRIHRSTIVNIDRVLEMQPYFHGEFIVVLCDGTKLKLSRGCREEASRLLGL